MEIWDANKLGLFLIFTIPGFISLKVYSSLFATTDRDWSKSIFEVVSFSTLNFVALSWLIFTISDLGYKDTYPFRFHAGLFLIFILAPTFWPFLFKWLSKTYAYKKVFLSPTKLPWDFVFSKKEAYWVIVYLK